MAEDKQKRCECFGLVRDEFFDIAKSFIKYEKGEFPMKTALDYLRAIEIMDTRLAMSECFPLAELGKRRGETGELIDEAKQRLGE